MEAMMEAKRQKDVAAQLIIREFRSLDLTQEQVALLIAYQRACDLLKTEIENYEVTK
jgi:hypothetical protein